MKGPANALKKPAVAALFLAAVVVIVFSGTAVAQTVTKPSRTITTVIIPPTDGNRS